MIRNKFSKINERLACVKSQENVEKNKKRPK